ncbi:MAG: GGDEF domain-containing protein [Candidatus Omnitrophica bacterium]|nr:GGDEF domain-containing protein [Candidatus Omnitrophota bacterium]
MVIRTLGRLLRLSSRRYRQVLIGCVATLGVSACLLATMMFVRWRAFSAVRSDTGVVLDQAAEQLLRTLQSRRGTLTLLRDVIDRAPDLGDAERRAIATSAVDHTRHLIAVGITAPESAVAWWVQPTNVDQDELMQWAQETSRRAQLRHGKHLPSAFTTGSSPRRVLIMLEPSRIGGDSQPLVGVFHLNAMLDDFFTLTLRQPYPVQLLESDQLLYRSVRWRLPANAEGHTVQQRPVKLNGINWVIQMQPGPTSLARTMSSFRILVMSLSALAALATIGMIWLLVARAWILQRAVDRRTEALRRTTERLRQLATTDELTSLYNRRFFLERWQWEYDRARRYNRPLVCLMIDVNRFKLINDLFGHSAGDHVLKQIAEELRRSFRQSDILARFGGDEFVAALPETTPDQAASVADKLRQLGVQGPDATPVRLSVGVGYLHRDESPQDILQQADADLYASRNVALKMASPASSATTTAEDNG